MENYRQQMALFLARTGALFFDEGLRLKDGRPTPYFVNLGRINTGRTGPELAGFFARMLKDQGLLDSRPVIIGPSYKGPPLAALIAAEAWREFGLELSYDYDRKEAKTHGEASGKGSMFVTGALAEATEGIIVDDVATSMATKVDLLNKIATANPKLKVTAVAVAVDREQTMPALDEDGRVRLGVKGEDAITGFTRATGVPVLALAPIREVVGHLHAVGEPVNHRGVREAISDELKNVFDDYLATYGR